MLNSKKINLKIKKDKEKNYKGQTFEWASTFFMNDPFYKKYIKENKNKNKKKKGLQTSGFHTENEPEGCPAIITSFKQHQAKQSKCP
jgi:hypothetical protein